MLPIRTARADELTLLNDIERIADRAYATVGLDVVLGMPQVALERLSEGPVWVACNEHDTPVGFVLAGSIGGFAYIEQISVLPQYGRQGIGSALMDTVWRWARTTPANALILSTYRDVNWNQPFYERHGYREMPESEWNAEIRAARKLEGEQGHDLTRRLFMWRSSR